MIDEKWINFAKEAALVGSSDISFETNIENWNELIQLVRLGLWAREHGIPAINSCNETLSQMSESDLDLYYGAWRSLKLSKEVLAALPKGE